MEFLGNINQPTGTNSANRASAMVRMSQRTMLKYPNKRCVFWECGLPKVGIVAPLTAMAA